MGKSIQDILPDRRLTEKEADQIKNCQQFKTVYVRGTFINAGQPLIEELVVTLRDGTNRELVWFTDGWEVDPYE